jgi:hypothetical protein
MRHRNKRCCVRCSDFIVGIAVSSCSFLHFRLLGVGFSLMEETRADCECIGESEYSAAKAPGHVTPHYGVWG